jgi:hypothetical protein
MEFSTFIALWLASGFVLALAVNILAWWQGEDITLGNLGVTAMLTVAGVVGWATVILFAAVELVEPYLNGDRVIIRGRDRGIR